MNGKSQINFACQRLFSYRHTHQNLEALCGALSVSLTHIKLHTNQKQHKSPAQTTFLRFVLGSIFDDVKLLDDFLLSALNRGTKRLEVFHEVRVSAVDMEDIMHSGYFISAKCGEDQSCTRTDIG